MTRGAGIPVLAASQFDPGMDRIEMVLPDGLTVHDIVRHALPGASAEDLTRVRVALVTERGSSIVPPAIWHRVRPRPGARVVIRLIPGKGVLRAVLSIVVAIAAVALGTMFAGPLAAALGWGAGGAAIGAGGALITAGVNLIGALLINALVPPVKPDDEKPRNTYSISGWRNRLDPDGAVPVVLGSLRYAPPFAARPYSEVIGDWQYIRAVFLFGEGRLALSDFRIGETAISEYDEVQMEIRPGLSSDLPAGLYPQQIVEEAIGVELTRPLPRDDLGEVIAGQPAIETPVIRTTGADARRASVILAFPGGLIRFNDEGAKRLQSVSIRIDQRLAGAATWQVATTLNISAKKAESFYRQHSWTLPQRGRWEIRLTMLSAESDDSKVQSRTVWAALQTVRPEYPIAIDRPMSLVAIRVRATHQLSGALDNLSALASRVCLDWDQPTGTWITRATSNPASLYRLVLQHPSNPKAVADAGLDLPALQDWHDFCRVKGLSYNRVLEQAGTSLRDVLTEIAAAGRATPRHDGVKWGVVVDRPSDMIVDHITPRNSWNFSCRRAYGEHPHGFIVRFQDETNDFKEAQRVIPWPGHTGSIDLTETLELPGITDPAVIFREARRRMHEAILRPDIYEVTQDGAVRVATRGDNVMLSHDVLSSIQKAARVRAVSGSRIVLDDEVSMIAGRSYGIRFRRFSAADTVGSSDVRTVVTDPGTTNVLTLSGTGPVPQADDLVLFGEAGEESVRVVVTQVEATEDMCSILRCVDAAPEIDALTDATVIPAWSGRVGAEIDANLIQPPAPRWESVSTVVDSGAAGVAYLIRPGSGAVTTTAFEIGHRAAGTTSWTTISIPAADGGGRIDGYADGQTIEMRARGISAADVAGPYGPTVSYQVGSAGAGVPRVLDADSISVTPLLGGARVEFATSADPNLDRVQIYRSRSATLDRETDAAGAPLSITGARTWSMTVGDTTRVNLLKAAGWITGPGWTVSGGVGAHAAGSAGTLSQAMTTQTGRWYRIGLTITDRTAGSVIPQLAGGQAVVGPTYIGNGARALSLQAASGNDQFELVASSTFDGSVSDLVAYLQTPACLAQGTHYLWLEPQNADGVPGPVSGPYMIEVI